MTAQKPSGDKKVAELQKKLKSEHTARLRLAADLANLERRVKADREKFASLANRDLLEKLFPIFDNFYRASSHAPEISIEDIPKLTEDDFKKIFNYFEGLRMIEKQLEQTLISAGMRRIPTVGHEFDPAVHEAVSHEPSTEHPADFIIAEVESGWLINDHVAKPAKVRVSSGL